MRYQERVLESLLTGRNRRVALTIDTELADHVADPSVASRLLDVLAGEDTRATFFLTGAWAQANPELACRLPAAGHLIGNHTYHHVPLPFMTDEGIRHTVRRAEDVIVRTTGVDPRPWFRCPYGAGSADPRVLRILEELGYRHVPWDVTSNDWKDGWGPAAVARVAVAGAVAVGDGACLLLHSWPDATAVALPQIITRLKRAGVRFVRLDEL